MELLFYEYEISLINNQDIGQNNFYDKKLKYQNHKRALSCIRYAIENVLQWNEKEAVAKFDSYIIHAMRLEGVCDYLQWPDEIIKGDPKYILSLLYPDSVKVNMQEKTEQLLKKILESENKQLPRGFFIGINGFYRYCACLKYLIKNFKWFESAEEVYEYFISPESDEFLERYKLKMPGVQLGINIIDCIHLLLNGVEYNDFYYEYYLFKSKLSECLHNSDSEFAKKLIANDLKL